MKIPVLVVTKEPQSIVSEDKFEIRMSSGLHVVYNTLDLSAVMCFKLNNSNKYACDPSEKF